MLRNTVEPICVVHQIVCDRCSKEAERGEPGFQEMTSIGFDAGYDSIFGDGNRVEIDLCEACLRDTLGTWLRVRGPGDTSLSSKLEKFKPELHGGEFPSSEPKNLEELADQARAAADRAMMAIDDMLTMVHASNERIADMERRASRDGTAKGPAHPMKLDRSKPVVADEDPSRPLSAAELGQALGIDEESVRRRERGGELFSILRPARNRGREYPAFQAWPGIAGAPLARVMAALQGASGPAAYGFFTSPTDLLGGLTPIEVMVGRAPTTHAVAPEAETLLHAPNEERMAATVEAAKAEAAQLASW